MDIARVLERRLVEEPPEHFDMGPENRRSVPNRWVVRDLKESDVSSAIVLIAGTVSHMEEYSSEQKEFILSLYTKGKLMERLRDGVVTLLATYGSGDLLGVGSYSAGRVSGMYVRRGHVGRGIGSRILEGLENRAKAAGASAISARASIASSGFYARRGYANRGPGSHSDVSGVSLPFILMVKDLDRQGGSARITEHSIGRLGDDPIRRAE